jgi:hypothetical protein
MMAQILDCLASYFGLDEQEEPDPRRYFCYHITGGPGPTPGSGIAVISTLALCTECERDHYCETFHLVDSGGPAAAVARAVAYLDAVHRGNHVRKVQSELRGLGDGRPADGITLAPPAPFGHWPAPHAPNPAM